MGVEPTLQPFKGPSFPRELQPLTCKNVATDVAECLAWARIGHGHLVAAAGFLRC